ncbi:plasmid mobilization protein [Nitrospirillum viridazoti]|uniref:plasmid mobilization protein n=1 Tax=Nitrospirillum viridazoti TaxID=3144925 RepID=UPI003CE4566B
MARPLKSPNALRKKITVWLSADERLIVQVRAAAAGIPLGDFIRRAAMSRHLREVPPIENIRMYQALLRLTMSLNQIGYQVRETGDLDREGLKQLLTGHQSLLCEVRTALLGGGPGRGLDD